MSWNGTNPVTVGAATKKDHYDRVFDNASELRTGGIAMTSQAAGDIVYAISATQLGRLASVAAGQVLVSGASAPSWSATPVLTAVVFEAASTSGVRLDLESGVLAVREGDDSAYAGIKASTAEFSGSVTIANVNATNELYFTGADFTNILSTSTSGMQIGTTGAAYFQLLTNGVERLLISSAGASSFSGTLAWGGGSAITSSDSVALLADNETVTGSWTFANSISQTSTGTARINRDTTHATNAVDTRITRSGVAYWLYGMGAWSGDNFDWQDGAALIARFARTTGNTYLKGTLEWGGGAAITSSDHVAVLADNETVTGSWTFTNDTVIGAEIYRSANDSYARLSGGNSAGAGANLILFGATHATNASKVQLNGSAGITLTGATSVSSTLAWGGGSAISSSSNVALLNGSNTFTGGDQTVSAAVAGGVRFKVANTSNSTSAFASIDLTNDATDPLGFIQAYSSTYTASGYINAAGVAFGAQGAGGLVLAATHASGDVEIWSRNTLAATFGASQAATFASTVRANGHVSLNAAASSWSTGNAFEAATGAALWGDGVNSYMTANYYYNAGDKFAGTGYAGYMSVIGADGSVRWYLSSASGTAGAAATMVESMRLLQTGDVAIRSGAKIRMDGTAGTGDTYLTEVSANQLRTVVGGVSTWDYLATGTYTYQDLVLSSTFKLRYDSSLSGDTYTYESAANTLVDVVGGTPTFERTAGAVKVLGAEAADAKLLLVADEGDDDGDTWGIYALTDGRVGFYKNAASPLLQFRMAPANDTTHINNGPRFWAMDGAWGTGAITGASVRVGRNSSGSGAAGWIDFVDKSGVTNAVWCDGTGDLRIGTAAPTESGSVSDTSGTVVGDQTSMRSAKNIHREFTDYSGALDTICSTRLWEFDFKSGSYGGQMFVGLTLGDDPSVDANVFGKDRDADNPWGKSLNEITLHGYELAAIRELNARLVAQAREMAETRARISELEARYAS